MDFFSPQTLLASTLGVLVVGFILARALRPKRFYFVRHGETILNAAHIRQGTEGGLTTKGKLQAAVAGEFLATCGITKLIVSPFERTRETAAIINEKLHVPILYSPLVAERRNPSEIIGKPTDDPTVAHIVDEMDMSYHDDNYRFSDEENFQDMKERARNTLNLLAQEGAPRTGVITHSMYLKMLIAYLLYRDTLHGKDYVKISYFNAADNAAVTVCEYWPILIFSKTRGWRVISYNQTLDQKKK